VWKGVCVCVSGVHSVDVVYDGLVVPSGPVCFTALSAASNRSKVTAPEPGYTCVVSVCVCMWEGRDHDCSNSDIFVVRSEISIVHCI